jgi:glycosyltransferase involved in cell wall biosynthesis
MTKLSVIVPCYNVAETVDLTLRSLLAQEVDLEVIAVEDCSTDATREILSVWAKRDERVRLVVNPANVGLASARNVGLSHVRGEFLAFADSDDWVAADFHRPLLAIAEEHALDFVRCDHTRVTDTTRTVIRAPEARRHETLVPASSALPIHTTSMVDYPYAWAGVLRTAFVRESDLRFPEGVRTAEDRPWIWQLHFEAKRYQCVSQAGYFYRQESASALTQIGDLRQLEFFRAMDAAITYLHKVGAGELLIAKAYRQLLSILASQYQRRSRLEPSVRKELKRRAKSCAVGFDERILELAVDGLDDYRVQLLSDLTGRRIPASA